MSEGKGLIRMLYFKLIARRGEIHSGQRRKTAPFGKFKGMTTRHLTKLVCTQDNLVLSAELMM